uniref:Uncharacterized protein n=1 Tax=Anguilla anguilla TaxID=7936 RepID=A0A0E9SAH8_ANGAN
MSIRGHYCLVQFQCDVWVIHFSTLKQ